jgi:predicted nuclease of predicted toxin-antitoxin system
MSITVDLDFAQLLAISGESLPSVILFRLGNVSREVGFQIFAVVVGRLVNTLCD